MIFLCCHGGNILTKENIMKLPIERDISEKSDMTDLRDEVENLLIDGLITDGAHHKQYYLERVFRSLFKGEYVDQEKEKFQWEDGIPD